jgi:hypothetical protein
MGHVKHRFVALLLPAVLAPLLAACMFQSKTLESGRQEVRDMRADPVLSFRLPGSTLRSHEEHAATEEPFGGGQTSSFVLQVLELPGEPGDAVQAYRSAAESGGWRFVGDGCSRVERVTAVVLGKPFAGFAATFVVSAQLEREELRSQPGDLARRGIRVHMEATEAGLHDLLVDVGLHRNDVQCLRGLDPSAPDLQRPGAPPITIGELCSRVPLDAVKAIAPEVERAQLEAVVEECWLVDFRGHPLFTVAHAPLPKAHYDDRRLPSTHERSDMFLFAVGGRDHPALGHAVWVASPRGVLVVGGGGALFGPSETDSLLFAAARAVAAS